MSNTNNEVGQCSTSQLKKLLELAQDRETAKVSKSLDFNMSENRLAELLGTLCPETPNAGQSLLSALEDANMPLPVLRELKNVAKRLQAKAATDEQKAATTLLYHLAVAAAFGVHGVNISTRVAESRLELYQELARRMASSALGQYFSLAVDRCLAAENSDG